MSKGAVSASGVLCQPRVFPSGQTQTINLQYNPEPGTALAFEWQQLWGANSVNVLLSSGDSFVLTSVHSQPAFFGVRSSAPIVWLQIAHAGGVLNLDNVSTDTVIPTPEPASILLLGTGVAGVLARARRRRQH